MSETQIGTPQGREELARQIAELSQANAALTEHVGKINQERRLLRTLIDHLPDAIYAKDTAGRKTLANAVDVANMGCKSEADAIGKSDFDLFPQEVASKFFVDDKAVFAGQPVINREEYFFDEKGQKHWLLTSK